MGRPKKSKQERREYLVAVRLTETEKESLEKLVAYSGTSVPAVIRNLVLKDRVLKSRISMLDQQTYLELKKIGTNINQIAKHYNSNLPVPAEKLKAFQVLNEKLNHIIKNLINDR